MKRLLATLALATVALAAAACSSTSATGGSAAPAAPADPNAPAITANNLKFAESTVAVPAGKAFQLTFTNQEGAPHNVAIYSDASAATQPVPRRDLQQRLEGLRRPGARRGQLLLPV